MFLQYSYCTPHTPASVDAVLLTILLNPCVNAGSAVMLAAVGAVLSKVIVSVTSVLIFHKLSLKTINTVLVPSPADTVCAILAPHVVQLVGLVVFQNATCTHPTPASVAQVVVSVTVVPLVCVALLFTVNVPPVGARLSCVLLVLALRALVLLILSLLLTK